MSQKRKEKWTLSKSAVIAILIINMLDVLVPAFLQPILPVLFRRNCSEMPPGKNSTIIDCQKDAEFQTGIVLGMMYVPSLLFAIPIGFVATNAVRCHLLFVAGLCANALATISLAFSRTFAAITVSTLTYGMGFPLCIVGYSNLIAAAFPVEKQRSRIFHATGIFATSGYALSFFFSTLLFTTIGKTWTLLIPASAITSLLCVYVITNWKHMMRAPPPEYISTEEVPLISEIPVKKLESRTGDAKWKDFGMAVLIYVQIHLAYVGLATVASTAPSRLQNDLGMSVVENGAILSLASLADVFVLSLMTLFVHSNKRRWICLLFFLTLQSTGFAAYPFAENAYLVMYCEVTIRSAKAVIMALGQSLIYTIVDVCGVGSYAHLTALYLVFKQGGQVVGSFSAPSLVNFFGFDIVYWSISVVALPVAIASISYARMSVQKV